MRRNFTGGLMFGAGILLVVVVGIAVAVATDILTIDKDGTIRLRVSDAGKVTLNTSDAAQGDICFTPRTSDPSAPLAGDLWYNDTVKEVKYADGGQTKPIASMTNADLTLYVNGATGNDNNNGLTPGTAVKTIQKAVNLVPPIVRHAVTINVAAGTYRDLGATVGSETVNVYVSDKVVTSSGSIVFVGDETTPANVRVTGSDSGADTTPVRNSGFNISAVRNVAIKGLLCNYFTNSGIVYANSASGNPQNCSTSNNTSRGIYYVYYSQGSPTTCTANSNNNGIVYSANSYGSPNGCVISSNSSDGILYWMNSSGQPSNNSSGTANGRYGISAWAGSLVDNTAPTPSGNTASTYEDTTNYSRLW